MSFKTHKNMMNKLICFALFIYFSIGFLLAQKPQLNTMADFMGANTNVASYDQNYLEDLSKCVKWIREYHNWSHYETANDYFKWDDFTKEPGGMDWPYHTKFMEKCNQLGVNVLIDVLGIPKWIGEEKHIPNSSGDGSKAEDYMEKLEFIGQLVARYGSKKIDPSLLKTADKISGLNYITYFEDDNEPDYWWWEPRWSADNYAKFCNAAHDGTGVHTSPEYPLLGIKSVDPDVKHVMAGLAEVDSVYLQKVLDNSEGKIPFDAINMHMYCTDMTDAYSPENEIFGYEKKFSAFLNWKERVLPNIPVWMTEFGWDTYKDEENRHSYTYADFNQQANYLLRSYFIFLKMGFDKAFMFMDTDYNSEDTLQYSSSGYFDDNMKGHNKKPSFYYQVLAQNILGSSTFKKVVAYGESSGNNEDYCFEFENKTNADIIYVMWTRECNSGNDKGAKSEYQLDLGYIPESAYLVFPKNLDEKGETMKAKVDGAIVNLNLTETPQFLIVSKK